MIVFLRCSTNNKAQTVREGFLGAMENFGCPDRVRTDHGGENIEIGRTMLTLRGEHSRPFITGPSTHNQRIERLWRDMNRVVLELFRTVFLAMENDGILDLSSPLQVLILHFVYLPRIQKNIDVFSNTWNSHKISTESMRTPRQLWVLGAATQGVSGNAPPRAGGIDEFYGVDFDGPISAHATEVEAVQVDDLFPAFQAELAAFQAAIDPEIDDHNYGVAHFLAGKALLGLV